MPGLSRLLVCLLAVAIAALGPAGVAGAAGATGELAAAMRADDGCTLVMERLEIPAGETLRIRQPGPAATVHVRVAGGKPARIDGTLVADGRVEIESDAGIRVAAGARLEAMALRLAGGAIVIGGTVQAAEIVLEGAQGEVVAVSGALDASSADAGGRGGSVRLLGEAVALLPGAFVDASGPAGGGTVLAGGNYRGLGPEPNARAALVAPGAVVRADSLEAGDGGRIIVWSEEDTELGGRLSARGGPLGGDGGFIETSSRGRLAVQGEVDAGAPAGTGGAWLLDPTDIYIQDHDNSCVAWTYDMPSNTRIARWDPESHCSPGYVNVATIATFLQGGQNVTVETTSDLDGQGDITLSDPLSVTLWNTRALRLVADHDILIWDPISASGTYGLDVFLQAQGDVTLYAGVTTNGGRFVSSGLNFTSTSSAPINAGEGQVDLSGHTGAVSLGAAVSSTHRDLLAAGTTFSNAGAPLSFTYGSIWLTPTEAITLAAGITSVTGSFHAQSGRFTSTSAGSIATGFGGEITITGTWGITLGAALTADGGTIRLGSASGPVSQASGTLAAPALAIQAGGPVSLAPTANINTLAASLWGGAGPFSFSRTGGYSVGAVSAAPGFAATAGVASSAGDVSLSAAAGDVTISQPVAVASGRLTVTLSAASALLSNDSACSGATVALVADRMALAGGTITATGGVTLTPASAARTLDLGGADSGSQLGLTNAELDTIWAPRLAIAPGAGGAVAASAAAGPDHVPVLRVTAGGSMTGVGPLGAQWLALAAGQGITLGTQAASVAAVVTGTGGTSLTNAGAVTLGTVDGLSGLSAPAGGSLKLAGEGIEVAAPVAAGGGGAVRLDSSTWLTVGQPIRSASGPITLLAGTDINLAVTGPVTSAAGDVTVTADHDGNGSGALTMADGALVDAGLGTVAVSAGGDVTLGRLASGAGGAAIAVASTGGSILDGGDYGGADLWAPSGCATLSAQGAIGVADPLETAAAELAATAAGAGGIDLASDRGVAAWLAAANGPAHLASTGTVATLGPWLGSSIAIDAGGPITLAHELTAATSLRLNPAAGGASQSAGSLAAAGLELRGAGDYALLQPGNCVGTLAGDLAGSVAYRDLDGLHIGAVGASRGLTASGALGLTVGGDITQTWPLRAVTLTVTLISDSTEPAVTLVDPGNEAAVVDLASQPSGGGYGHGNLTYRDASGVMVAGIRTAANAALTAGGPISQSGNIVAARLDARTLCDAGAGIDLSTRANKVTTIDLRVRNAAGSANAAGCISYRGNAGYGVAGLYTTGGAMLRGGSAVSQSGPVVAAELELLGATYTLSMGGNDVQTLAGSVSGALTYAQTGALAVGSVGSSCGITAGTSVSLTAGGLLVGEAITAPVVDTNCPTVTLDADIGPNPPTGHATQVYVLSPAAQIQDGIDVAEPSAGITSTVKVAAGTYEGGVTVDRTLVLEGAGPGVTVVDGLGGDYALSLSARDATVRGFTLHHATYGIFSKGSRRSRIEGNDIHDAGTGIYLDEESDGATILGNRVFGNGEGITTGGPPLGWAGVLAAYNHHAHFNRIVGNGLGVNNPTLVGFDAADNWWGCNGGPGAEGCDRCDGTAAVDVEPWLVLGLGAAGVPVPVGGGRAILYADLTHNSQGAAPAGGHVPDGTPATLVAGPLGSVDPAATSTSDGRARSVFTSGATTGTTTVTATVDSQSVSLDLAIVYGVGLPLICK